MGENKMKFLITATTESFYEYNFKLPKGFKVSKREIFIESLLQEEGIKKEVNIIEIKTIEDLIRLQELCENELIITDTKLKDGTKLKTIEVYNDYRE